MAAACHVRSNSFPSRPHPEVAQVDRQLSRLRSSEATSTSSASINKKLNNLQDLHGSLIELLQLPHTQQALSQEQNKQTIEQLLDGSLKLLDFCSISKDAFLQIKEGLNEIQSIIRRKSGDLSSEVKTYFASRKSLQKSLEKVLKSLKATKNESNKDRSLVVFGEAEAVTISVFDSLLCFISGSKSQTKACSKWSLVSKLTSQKRITCEGEASSANEFARLDSMFHLLVDKKSEKPLNIEEVQSLEMCIGDLEDGLESLFKSLIKFRVSFLNILGR